MTPEFHVHYRCFYCHAVRSKQEIIHFNNQPVCRDGDCLNHMKGDYHASLFTRFADPWPDNDGTGQ